MSSKIMGGKITGSKITGNPPEQSIHRLPPATWQDYLLWILRQRQRFQVVESSMLPTLKPGTTVLATRHRPPSVKPTDIVIAQHPFKPKLLLIKRVQEIFSDGGCFLISDNRSDPTAQDSRSLGVFDATLILSLVTRILP